MLISIDKYVAAAALSAKNYLAYVSEMIFRSGFLVVILFVFVNLWTVTYSRAGAEIIAGFDLRQMLWYLVFTESIVISRPRVHQKVEEDIRTGAVSYTLARPYNYLLELVHKSESSLKRHLYKLYAVFNSDNDVTLILNAIKAGVIDLNGDIL